jgi:hypothetical protein
MEARNKSFNEINGMSVNYARKPVSEYGTKGKQYTFYCNDKFFANVERFFEDLSALSGLGMPQVLTSAGFYVAKNGYHGHGRAFDLDALFWKNRKFVTLNAYPEQPKFYMAVECVIRRHFGLCLGWLYNPAHRDHFHIDDSKTVDFHENSRSNILFIQGIAQHIFGMDCDIDGLYGKGTETCLEQMLVDTGLRNTSFSVIINVKREWREFLKFVALLGFSGKKSKAKPEKEKNPLELLHSLYATINDELGSTALRKPVEASLNSFSNHPEVQEFLSKWRD